MEREIVSKCRKMEKLQFTHQALIQKQVKKSIINQNSL
jgi:hypothetical protein